MNTVTAKIDQIQYWNETAGPKWVRYQATLDAQIGPLGLAAMERLAVGSGERVLDVGCGCGATTLELAGRVGPSGSVLGVDVSAPMVEVARRRLAAAGFAHARVELGDATTQRFEPGERDALFSRFGVMFFPDPTAAFRNLRGALRSDGRLGFVCWQPVDRNPWTYLALKTASQYVTLPPRPGPEDPGPFSFADAERVRRILGGAGFVDVVLEPHEQELVIAAGASYEDAIDFLVQLGPMTAALKDASEADRERVTVAVREALAPHVSGGELRLGSATWLVRARAA